MGGLEATWRALVSVESNSPVFEIGKRFSRLDVFVKVGVIGDVHIEVQTFDSRQRSVGLLVSIVVGFGNFTARTNIGLVWGMVQPRILILNCYFRISSYLA